MQTVQQSVHLICKLFNSYFQRLTKGKHIWSLAEVVHAIVLLAHFHSLSAFVFSCGLIQELNTVSSQNQLDGKINQMQTNAASINNIHHNYHLEHGLNNNNNDTFRDINSKYRIPS